MDSASQRFCITYNGEIYNYCALREKLRGRGYRFRSDSDTEMLVEGLEEWSLLGLPTAVSAFLVGDDRQAPIIYDVFALAVWWEQILDGGIGARPNTSNTASCMSAIGTIGRDGQPS